MNAAGLESRWNKIVPYAWASAVGSTVGAILGMLSAALPLKIPSAVLSAGGFTAGAIIAPIIQHLLSSRREPGTEPLSSVTTELPPAVIESSANRAVPYAFAAALGSTLACAGAVLIALLSPRTPLHLLTAAGFVLGAFAGVTIQFIDGLITPAPTETVPTGQARAANI